MEKLPVKFKEKWIKALRSGEYEQTKESLYDGKGMCCLGVACHIAGVAKYDMEMVGIPVDMNLDTEEFELPYVLRENTNEVDCLTAMNDGVKNNYNPEGKQYSFEEIADWVEQNL